MEIINNVTICQVSINIDKFSITVPCLTHETCGPTMRTYRVVCMGHGVMTGLKNYRENITKIKKKLISFKYLLKF